jgi:hypothetical protein
MGRAALCAALTALVAVPVAAQVPVDAARQLYNQGNLDGAVKLAARLRNQPALADAANLVLGRSYLERFRQSADPADLVAGREALSAVKPRTLGRREQAEYLVGLGESLYLQDAFGPAAQIFASALERAREIGPQAFDRVFDWWATSIDRHAQSGLVDDVDSLYGEVLFRSETALAQVPGSSAPAYWTVVAARSLGDLSRAWDAAVAAWVRARMAPDDGAALRADLDRLVLQALIPERVRQMATTDVDRERAAASLRSAWEEVKREWAAH